MAAERGKYRTPEDLKVEKWDLPSVNSPSSRVFRNEDEKPEKEKDEPHQLTVEQLESIRQQAEDEGYQQGLLKAKQETAELQQRLHDLINFFESPLQALNEEVEQQLSLLAVTLAQQLVRREIREEPGEIIGVIRESVQLLPANSRKIRISLNPEDADLVRSSLQLDEHDEELSWKLIEDPMISRGGCEIKADKSVINATLENRLQSLAASVLGGDRLEDQDATSSD